MAEQKKTILKVDDINVYYGSIHAIKGVSFEVSEGEIVTLIGANGAGKSTTLRAISGLVKTASGAINFLGRDIIPFNAQQVVAEGIAMVPEGRRVFDNLTVKENLEFMARLYGFGKEKTAERVNRTVADFHLEEVLDQRAGTLSGGWKRKLSIAMALIGEPSVLFLDEPTLGLDVLARRELWRVIEAMKGSLTIVLTTHYMEEEEHLSDRLGIMISGRIAACGTLQEILELTGKTTLEDAFVAIAEGEVTEE